MNQIPLADLEDLLEDRKIFEKAVNTVDVDFELAALIASTRMENDIQLPFGYKVEISSEDL